MLPTRLSALAAPRHPVGRCVAARPVRPSPSSRDDLRKWTGSFQRGGVVKSIGSNRRIPIPQHSASETAHRLEVWFDGGCPLCQREIAVMQRLDRAGRIRFIDLTGSDACPLDRAEMLARFHARENGVILSGAAAFAAMWRAIPLLRPLGLAARLPGVEAMLEWLYVRFLRIRPRLQEQLR